MENPAIDFLNVYRSAFGCKPRLSRDSVLRHGIALHAWTIAEAQEVQVAPVSTMVLLHHLPGSADIVIRQHGGDCERLSLPGAVSLVPAGQGLHLQSAGPFDIALLSFPRSAPPPAEPSAWNRLLRLESCVLACEDDFVSATMRALMNAIETPPRDGLLYFCQMFDSLVFHLARISDNGQSELKPQSIKRHSKQIDFDALIDFIESHLSEKLDLALLAKQAGVSRSSLAETFRREFGISPHQFIIRQRIEYAKKYLHQQNRSVTEIAHELGFSGQSHFSTTFKRITGLVPTDYAP